MHRPTPSEAQRRRSPPSALFGALFERVQSERLFADSKTFPDLDPLDRPDRILERFEQAGPLDRAGLRDFVDRHFSRPSHTEGPPCRQGQDLLGRINQLWDVFIRQPGEPAPEGSLLQTEHAYVVPGGRFAEAYYWDSFFSLLGLVADGREAEATDIVRGFAALIDRIGHIPNGARTYYLGRSQPPLFYLMADLVGSFASDRETLQLLRKEHAFWMDGADALASGEAHRRVVKLPDGSILNRYWDDLPGPRDEAYAEDRALARPDLRPEEELYRDIRAAAESGWDFSSRWLSDPTDLASIRTTAILPIDLNAFLWGLENDIRQRALALGDAALGETYAALADARAGAIRAWLWTPETSVFCDFDWRAGLRQTAPTAALLTPLFVGLANPAEAAEAAAVTEARLLRAGGLVTTELETGQQWDAPNGWAPLQWMAVIGLGRYDHAALAETIADRWLDMVSRVFAATGQLFEKYDVVAGSAGGGGEYAPQDGFGWTNGVTRALIRWRNLDEAAIEQLNRRYAPRLAESARTAP